jgi:hypothetical protein
MVEVGCDRVPLGVPCAVCAVSLNLVNARLFRGICLEPVYLIALMIAQ